MYIYIKQTLPGPVTDPAKLPKWNYDGSSTDQAPGDDSEVILQYVYKYIYRSIYHFQSQSPPSPILMMIILINGHDQKHFYIQSIEFVSFFPKNIKIKIYLDFFWLDQSPGYFQGPIQKRKEHPGKHLHLIPRLAI